jgi:hypothetical protein
MIFYSLQEVWSIVDTFYFSVTTLTTVATVTCGGATPENSPSRQLGEQGQEEKGRAGAAIEPRPGGSSCLTVRVSPLSTTFREQARAAAA